jgi:putative copper resistance protein D
MTLRTRVLAAGVAALLALAPAAAFAHGAGQPAPAFPGILWRWELDPLLLIGLGVAVWLYTAGVMRVNRLHPDSPVPRKRIVCFGIGIATLVIALISPMGVYDTDLFSVHMLQHVLIMDVATPFLLLGAPLTLLLRASTPDVRRRYVLPFLHSHVVRLLTFPVVAWVLFAVVLWSSHYSGLYDEALVNNWVHRGEHGIYLFAALLFWWQAIGIDPAPWRMPYPVRIMYVFLIMPQTAWLGLAFYGSDHVIYAHYASIVRTWGPSPLTDQEAAGVIMWLIGDMISMGWLAYLIARWVKHEELATERKDRELARERAQRAASAAGTTLPGA